MKIKLAIFAFALCSIFLAGNVSAHHSFAVYDIRAAIDITGVVESYVYRRPHPKLTLIDGDQVKWEIEVPIMFWERAGYASDAIKPGDKVTIHGWPARNGSPKMAMSGFKLGGTYYNVLAQVNQKSGVEAANRIENGESLESVLKDYPAPTE